MALGTQVRAECDDHLAWCAIDLDGQTTTDMRKARYSLLNQKWTIWGGCEYAKDDVTYTEPNVFDRLCNGQKVHIIEDKEEQELFRKFHAYKPMKTNNKKGLSKKDNIIAEPNDSQRENLLNVFSKLDGFDEKADVIQSKQTKTKT